jgi:ferritin-like metal-binding protein YciE
MSGTLKASETAVNIYITGLRHQHAVENEAIALLERQVGRLENYPEMQERMQQHIGETHEQARRLDALLDALGSTASSVMDTALGFRGDMAAPGDAATQDEVIKNCLANFAFENYEIAGYKALLALAEHTGHAAAMRLLATSLREEQAMARWIDDHLAQTALTFVRRCEQGQRAGV